MEKWAVKSDECIYTSCYCEENIWKLCEKWKQTEPDHIKYLFAVFISNENKQIPIWEQKSAGNSEHLALWDYHVILIDKSSSPPVIYDFDSMLPFPVSTDDYLLKAIRDETEIYENYHRYFRVISAQDYLNSFASDRSHMLRADKKTYNSPPPTYPPISNERSTNNIHEFIDMKSTKVPGIIMNLRDFRCFLGFSE